MLQLIYSFAWKNSHMAIGLAFEHCFLSSANSESTTTEYDGGRLDLPEDLISYNWLVSGMARPVYLWLILEQLAAWYNQADLYWHWRYVI